MSSRSETNVLLVSPMPPSVGGIATWTGRIVRHGLPAGYRLNVVDTAVRNRRRTLGYSRRAGEIRRTVRIMGAFLAQLAGASIHLVHLNCSVSPRGVFRDLACARLARLRGTPVVTHWRGGIPAAFEEVGRGHLPWRALAALVRTSSLNIALDAGSLQCLAGLQGEAQRAPVLLPNFVEDPVFRHPPACVRAPPVRLQALYAGSVMAAKGCREILDAARRLPEVDFVLLGPVHADMAHLMHDLPANLALGGEVAPDVVLEHMRSSDLFVMPTFHAEGFPNAVLEAMAAGLPVIATRAGSIPEMIDEGEGGLLVRPRRADELAAAIRTLAGDPSLRMRMGWFNRRKSEAEYARPVVIARLAALYRQVLQEHA